MKEILTKCSKLNLLPEFIKITARQASKQLPVNDRQIVFSLDDDRLYSDCDGSGRHAYLMLNAFDQAGYNVYLYKNVDFLMYTRLGKYGRYLYALDNVKVISRLPKNVSNMIYAFDSVYPEVLDLPWKKKTYVNILKSPYCQIQQVIPIPFSMHPIWYHSKGFKKVRELRSFKRSLKILFGGNTSKSYYSSPKFKNYGLLTRAEGLEAAYTLNDRVKAFAGKEDINAIFDGNQYFNECRILKTDDKIVGVENRWLELVAKSDFFLCLSGTDLPMCHNAIEAMSVGTIPIVEYAHWFTPALEHMKNAVLYKGKEDLVSKLQQVFTMPPNEIEILRKGVIQFYDEHLGGPNFVRRYERNKDSVNTIMLYPHFVPTTWEDQISQKVFASLNKYFVNDAGGKS